MPVITVANFLFSLQVAFVDHSLLADRRRRADRVVGVPVVAGHRGRAAAGPHRPAQGRDRQPGAGRRACSPSGSPRIVPGAGWPVVLGVTVATALRSWRGRRPESTAGGPRRLRGPPPARERPRRHRRRPGAHHRRGARPPGRARRACSSRRGDRLRAYGLDLRTAPGQATVVVHGDAGRVLVPDRRRRGAADRRAAGRDPGRSRRAAPCGDRRAGAVHVPGRGATRTGRCGSCPARSGRRWSRRPRTVTVLRAPARWARGWSPPAAGCGSTATGPSQPVPAPPALVDPITVRGARADRPARRPAADRAAGAAGAGRRASAAVQQIFDRVVAQVGRAPGGDGRAGALPRRSGARTSAARGGSAMCVARPCEELALDVIGAAEIGPR